MPRNLVSRHNVSLPIPLTAGKLEHSKVMRVGLVTRGLLACREGNTVREWNASSIACSLIPHLHPELWYLPQAAVRPQARK